MWNKDILIQIVTEYCGRCGMYQEHEMTHSTDAELRVCMTCLTEDVYRPSKKTVIRMKFLTGEI